MIVGCYTLHLYCSNEDCDIPKYRRLSIPDVFVGDNKRIVRKEARRVGWRFTRGDCICPVCVRKKKGGQ